MIIVIIWALLLVELVNAILEARCALFVKEIKDRRNYLLNETNN